MNAKIYLLFKEDGLNQARKKQGRNTNWALTYTCVSPGHHTCSKASVLQNIEQVLKVKPGLNSLFRVCGFSATPALLHL